MNKYKSLAMVLAMGLAFSACALYGIFFNVWGPNVPSLSLGMFESIFP